MKALPPIPAHFFSQHGNVPVGYLALKKAEKKNLIGYYNFCARTIALRPGMARPTEWLTLWHEATHVAMMDGGVRNNVLTADQEEVVCDVMGNYLTAMMEAGWLTVTVPKDTVVRKR